MKYLGIRIDSKLNWKAHIDDILLKLIRANTVLYKVRDFVNAGIWSCPICSWSCPIWITFSLCMYYMGGRIYMHNQSSSILQKKASRLICFKERNTHTDSLFFNSKMVKLPDKIKIENCLFISKNVNNKLSPIFNSCFIFTSTSHNYETSFTNSMVKD